MIAIIAGFLAGLLAGALGVGGGSVTIPFLLFVLNVPIERAIATNLLIVEMTSLASLYFHARQGTLRKRGVIMGIWGVLGAIIGNVIFFQLKGIILEKILGVAFIALAILVRLNKEGFREPSLRELSLTGLAMGVYSGITGKGGGSLAVPLLVLAFKVKTKEAIGATAAATPIVALSSLLPKATAGLVCYDIALQFLPGLTLGAMIGVKIMKRSKPETLRTFFSAFLIVVGVKMLMG